MTQHKAMVSSGRRWGVAWFRLEIWRGAQCRIPPKGNRGQVLVQSSMIVRLTKRNKVRGVTSNSLATSMGDRPASR